MMYACAVHVCLAGRKSKSFIEDMSFVDRKKFPDCLYQQLRHSF